MGNPAPTPSPFHVAPSWEQAAACRDADPELFFPVGTTGPAVKRQRAEARAVCAGCPVRLSCLVDGLAESDGVRAGLDAPERDPLARAHGVYRTEVTRLDEALHRTAATTDGAGEQLRLASRGLAAEADTTAALALSIAAGAEAGEVQEAAELAEAMVTESAVALAEIGLTHPSRLRQAAQQLLAAAVAVAAAVPNPALAVAS